MKKFVIRLLFIGVVILDCFGLLVIVTALPRTFCFVRGGKMFDHAFSRNCEVPAKDAGKICVSDSECKKNNCVYPTSERVYKCYFERTQCIKQTDFPPTGHCDEYYNDNDGALQCHRESEKSDIKCDFWIT